MIERSVSTFVAITHLFSIAGCAQELSDSRTIPAGASAAVVVEGHPVIIGPRGRGLSRLLLETQGELSRIMSPDGSRIGPVYALATNGDIVVAALVDEGGIAVLAGDSDPPLRLISVLEDESIRGHSKTLAIAGQLCAVSHSQPQPNGPDSIGVSLVDLAEPTAPRLINTIRFPLGSDHVAQMVIEDSLLLVAARRSGLFVYDITYPSAVKLVSHYEPRSWSRGVAVSGRFAYLAVSSNRGWSWVQTLDISVPRNPRLVVADETSGIAQQLAVSGSYLYAADREGGLRVYDIAEGPARLVARRRLRATGVTANDSIVVVWDGVMGLGEVIRHPQRLVNPDS